jgi:para-nitrobenzyl esterase
VVNVCIRGYRVRKIRKLYGDGSEGYVFDVADKNIEQVNRQNRTVHGEYDAECAVRTRTGTYVGEKYKKTRIFMGIPYAKPPVGELRWKAFPRALIVAGGKLTCDNIEDRITEVKGLLDYMVK